METGNLNVKGSYWLPLTREQTWHSLNDPEVLKHCIKGCEQIARIDDHHFEAVFVLKVGPVKKTFKAELEVVDDQAPENYLLLVEMQAGLLGQVQGRTEVMLAEREDQTLLEYDADISVSNWFARLGIPLLSETAERYMDRFIDRFIEKAG